MKFLFDRNLDNEEVVQCAINRGYPDSRSVTELGMAETEDADIITFAMADDWTIVTNNTNHFWPTYRVTAVHPGLACLKYRELGKYGQLTYFQNVLNKMNEWGFPNLNNIVAIAIKGEVRLHSMQKLKRKSKTLKRVRRPPSKSKNSS